MQLLVNSAAIELWAWSEFVQVRGYASPDSLSLWFGRKDFDTSCWRPVSLEYRCPSSACLAKDGSGSKRSPDLSGMVVLDLGPFALRV